MKSQAVGYDWYLLEDGVDPKNTLLDVEMLDKTLASVYTQILAGEPGVKIDAAVGLRRVTPASPTSAKALRVHLTHLPLLGARKDASTHLASLAGSTLFSNSAWWNELRPYQLEGAAFAASRSGCIIGDDLGLGKTRTGLAAAKLPLLILCPKTAISIWEDECTYAGLPYTTLEGRPGPWDEVQAFFKTRSSEASVWLLNYHVAAHWVPYFSRRGLLGGIHTLLCDEAHYLQKQSLAWTETIGGISRERCILMTATPLRNRLRSLWSLLHVAAPRAFGTLSEFRQYYCGATPGLYGLEDGRTSDERLERLRSRLDEIIIKRTREEVGHEVPPLDRKLYPVGVDLAAANAVRDEAAKKASLGFGGGHKRSGATLAWYTEMRKQYGRLKVPAAVNLTSDILECESRIVFWAWHEEVLDELRVALQTRFPDIPVDMIVGKTSQKRRNAVARLWKAARGDKPELLDRRFLLVSIAAASQAVSFTTAATCIFLELDWAPLQMVQAEKRTHRFGQIGEKCTSYYLTVRNTIDETVGDVLLDKAQESERILGSDGQVDQMQAMFGGAACLEETKEAQDAFLRRIAAQIVRTATT